MIRSEKEHNPKAIQLISWPHDTNSLETWLPTTKFGLAITLLVIPENLQHSFFSMRRTTSTDLFLISK